jgi:hypothetical protein
MALFKKLGKAVKKAVGGGAVASSQRMAPAMRGAVASMPDRMPQQSPSMPDRMPQQSPDRMPETGQPATNTGSGRTLARMPEIGLPATKTNSGGLSSVIKRQPAVVNSSTPRKSSSVMGKMAGAVATASKKMQPALGRAAAKPAVGAPLQKKSIGKVIGRGLIGRR